MQDAALSIAMNLAATAESRSYVRNIDAIPILTHIAESRDRALTASRDYSIEEVKQLEFQCMKAVSSSVTISSGRSLMVNHLNYFSVLFSRG
jgi:hypothetical protein